MSGVGSRIRSMSLGEWAAVVTIVVAIGPLVGFLSSFFDDNASGGDASVCDEAIDWFQVNRTSEATSTVRGPVISTSAPTGRGEPTFLNLGESYPDPERVAVVIFGDDRSNFRTSPEDLYEDREIAVTGEISRYGGAFELVANDPSDIVVCD